MTIPLYTHIHTGMYLFQDYTLTSQILMTVHLHSVLCEYTCLPPPYSILYLHILPPPHILLWPPAMHTFIVPAFLWEALCTLDLSYPST